MCRFKSGIILKNRVVLASIENESHSDLLESLGIEDNDTNSFRVFVRAELIPKDNNKATNVDDWKFVVDQDITPSWFDEDRERYEQGFREAVKEWVKENLIIICGYAWNKIKEDNNCTYYLMNGTMGNYSFGNTNNYANSSIREMLNSSNLLNKLKETFGDKLVPISNNLTSLNGLKDYGIVDGDLLSIPNLDLYRECRENIQNIDNSWWLATPDSILSGRSASIVLCVTYDGCVRYLDCDLSNGVRPFFIIKS